MYLRNYTRFSNNILLRTITKNIVGSNRNIFQGSTDRFNGVTVDTSKENCDIKLLPIKLKDSLDSWRIGHKRAVWFKVGLNQAEWIPILVKNGFDYHHAQGGYVMMYQWLPKTTNRVPSYAHTILAAGAIVVKDQTEILVVQEKNFPAGFWKFPGGIVEPGEHLENAVVREVKEETNIDTEFHSLISVVHAHNGQFGCSDIYAIFELHPISYDIKVCEQEIAKCEWINIDEFLYRTNASQFNKSLVQNYLNYKRNNIKIGVQTGVHLLTKRPYAYYCVHCNTNKTEV